MKTMIFVVAIIATTLLQIPKTFSARIGQNNSARLTQKKTSRNDSVKSKDLLNEVLSAYLAMKNALANDDGKTARASAKTLITEINKVPMAQMTTDQHTVWMKYMKRLSYDAEHISETDDAEHQREHFVTLSKNIFAVEKAFNTNAITLYYQFCQMANAGKGAYWVSEKEQIINPYMGKKMPICGSTKEILKK